SLEDAILDNVQRKAGDALTVEGVRGEPTPPCRIVIDLDRLGEDALAELAPKEAGLAGDGGATDRAGEMADQPSRNAGIVDHGSGAGGDVLRVEAADGAFARLATYLRRGAQLGAMRLGLGVVVALHAGAFASDRRGGQAEARAEIGAGETVRSGEHQPAE